MNSEISTPTIMNGRCNFTLIDVRIFFSRFHGGFSEILVN